MLGVGAYVATKKKNVANVREVYPQEIVKDLPIKPLNILQEHP